MTDKKLTDNEIIKALECCLQVCEDCSNCPLLTNKHTTVWDCKADFSKFVIDLINRLQAENEKSKNNCDKCAEKTRNCIESLQKIIAEQKAEIERLESECDKQYKIAEATIRAEIADGGTSCHWCEDIIKRTAKAEAYKECIEKVKEEIYSQPHSRSLEASVERARIIKIFDNLLKELVGTNFTQMFMNVDKLNPIPNNEKELVGEDNA